jgi:signal transduction histidine kinase
MNDLENTTNEQQLAFQAKARERLEQEHAQLSTQVQQLVRVERSMLEFQEKLDQQIKQYQQLNDIAKQLKTTFEPLEILAIALDFVVYGLNFERCVILAPIATSQVDHPMLGSLSGRGPLLAQTLLWEGYDDQPVTATVQLDAAFWPLLGTQDCVASPTGDAIGTTIGQPFDLDEWVICGIRPQSTDYPAYLLLLGNTADRAKLFTRVSQTDYTVVLASLLAQISGAIAQAQLYQASCDQSTQLQITLDKLRSTQTQLIQTEKMSSLGQLVAGIAHEINNPVNFIQGNLNYAQTYSDDLLQLINTCQNAPPSDPAMMASMMAAIDFDFLQSDFPQVITSMKMGVNRIQEIVLSLRNFSRLDESEYKSVNLHDGLESTLLILQHRFKVTHERPAITLIKQYGDLPRIECAAGLINQVFMNLISNAIDAMESATCPPAITIATATESDGVSIRIIDNGTGIPTDIQSRLFDPFFTTKPVGKGTGLGLSISYQIITEKHGGKLVCHSTPGNGTEFHVWLPIAPQPAPH